MRKYFKDIFSTEDLGSRTKQLPGVLARAIMEANPTVSQEEALKKALDALKTAGIKVDGKKSENSALFFISKAQILALAELVEKNEKDKSIYKQALKDNPSLDIALFGRMVADDPSLNYDAASQVAHAISTHEVQTEYDYFTAVDDEQAEGQSGAAHLSTVEYNSATLYRYATVNVAELAANLGPETARVVRGFVEAFTCSMPTGKQNTFANRTLPDMLYVTARCDQPVSLSGAFEKAINSKEGYAERSCKVLLSYADKLYNTFADKPELALGCGDKDLLNGYAEVLTLKELLSRIESYTAEFCQKGKV